MKYLFIGGTLSGKSINVPEGSTYKHIVRLARQTYENAIKTQPPDIPHIEEVYEKAQVNSDQEFFIFLHCSIKPEHITKLLKLSHGQEKT